MSDALLMISLLAQAMVAIGTGDPVQATSDMAATSIAALPGREADGRVASLAFRLATGGRRLCPLPESMLGLALQHLSQFELRDRPGMIATQALDRGPGVTVVVPGSPAAMAGIRLGDVLLAIDGRALPHEEASAPFNASSAHARADAIADLLAASGTGSFAIAVLRNGVVSTITVSPVPGCPSHVHLARSNQRNAYADGRHVFLTTGLLSRLQDDDELGFVVAHEMAHNILGHAAVMRGGTAKHGLRRTLGRSGQIVRKTERDADALGGEIMLEAGLDPVAGAAILKRLSGDLGIGLFSAHDSASARIAAMRALAQAWNISKMSR